MKFNKLIFIRYMPLTLKVYKDFYMEEIENVGIEVEYWDVTSLFFKHNHEQEDSSLLTTTRKFYSYKELELAITENKPAENRLFISIMTFEGRVSKLHRLFTKYDCKTAIFGRNMFPMPISNISFFGRIRELTFKRLQNFLQSKILIQAKKRGLIKPYDILFLAGTEGWKGVGKINLSDTTCSKVVKINSNDFDHVLSLNNVKPVVDGNYILFLDEYLPLHPDTILFGIKNISADQYYPQLNTFFERIEKQFNKPVIISAHPKAIRYKTEDFFNGRAVYFNQTLELSKYAEFVLAHDTTSINYPITFGKKLHFITSENIYREINMVHRNTVNFANFLGCNVQWFDKEGPINLIDSLPLDNYESYKYHFQTSRETENILTKDILLDFLLS